MDSLSPIDRAEQLLDGGASVLDSALALARERGITVLAARVHVLRALERQQREQIQIREAGAGGVLKSLREIADTALRRVSVARDGSTYPDPDVRAAVDAQKAIARILGLDQEDTSLRRGKARLTAARATEAEHKARSAPKQLELGLKYTEARIKLADKAPSASATLADAFARVLGKESSSAMEE